MPLERVRIFNGQNYRCKSLYTLVICGITFLDVYRLYPEEDVGKGCRQPGKESLGSML